MNKQTGTIHVSTENIFPIIRKWLYSDQDIFIRELISNASDAILKLQELSRLGQYDQVVDPKIHVQFDQLNKTLTISDNGIGMTKDEIQKYINEIAYSGAVDFIHTCEENGASGDGIIGHFGLGFYSAFMVSEKVMIKTKSYQENEIGAFWESEDGVHYEMGDLTKDVRGTDIILHLNEEFMSEITAFKVRQMIEKYCKFMSIPIYFEEKKEKKEADSAEVETDVCINEHKPLWLFQPNECKKEDYLSFYHEACHDIEDPLFWIHLNMDYPFSLKGILYFPKMNERYPTLDGRIKLYSNQVFVADNLKEVIPDFLFLLKGFLDCPDLPLNVSRSYLQSDSYVNKLSEHIVKKVADKLVSLYKNEFDEYKTYWKDIHVFIKYGALRNPKFYDRVKSAILFETSDHHFKTLSALGDKVYYTDDPDRQVNYMARANSLGYTVVLLQDEIDLHFISFLEMKNQPLKFIRIDSELETKKGNEKWLELLMPVFTSLEKAPAKVEAISLGEDQLGLVLAETEQSRRNAELQKSLLKMQGKMDDTNVLEMFPVEFILQINTDSPLIKELYTLVEANQADSDIKEKIETMANELFDLAKLSHGSLKGEAFNQFLLRTTKLLKETL